MNYKIVTDVVELINFIEWLPDLQENEKFYCSLFARKKYCPDIIKSSDKTQLKRFVSTKDRLFHKIKQLELELGNWMLRNTVVTQEALVLYINPNPRDMRKATFQMIQKCAKLIENNNASYNIHAEALSCIQRSRSYAYVVDFDIDTKDVDLSKLNYILPKHSYEIVETKGGYHILAYPQQATTDGATKNWHKKITEIFPVDQTGDALLPVPGTYQGGFTPRFLK